jgi:putative ABC transport system permease protein
MRIPRIGLMLYLFLSSSRIQKKRAILTIASIAWGTLSLLLLLAFGEGLTISASTAMQGIGKDIAVLWPGTTSLIWQGLPPGRPIRLEIEAVELLKKRVENLAEAAGEIQNFGVGVKSDKTETNATIKGVTWGFGEIRNHIPSKGGRFIDIKDEQLQRRVAFLGDEIAKKIYGNKTLLAKSSLLKRYHTQL